MYMHILLYMYMCSVKNKVLGLAGHEKIFNWPSVQFDTNKIKIWVAIISKCTENGQWPSALHACTEANLAVTPVKDS